MVEELSRSYLRIVRKSIKQFDNFQRFREYHQIHNNFYYICVTISKTKDIKETQCSSHP